MIEGTASYLTFPSKIPARGITAQGSPKLLDLHSVHILSPQKTGQIRGLLNTKHFTRSFNTFDFKVPYIFND
jgi:hypothetical protein